MPSAAESRGLATVRRSGLRLKSYDAVYASCPDPWSSTVKGSGRKRLSECFGLVSGRSFGRVLEIGCAGGYFAKRLSRISGSVLGVDIASAALRRARTVCRGTENVRFELGNFLELRPRGRFDLVCCLNLIPDFEPRVQNRFLDRIRALLRREGLFLCSVTARPYGLFRPAVFERELVRRFQVLERRPFATAGRSSRYGHLAFLSRKEGP